MIQNRIRLAARRTAAFVLSGTLMASSLCAPATALAKTDAEIQQELHAATEQLDALQMELAQSEAVLGKTTYNLAVTKSNIADLQLRISQNKQKLVTAKHELAEVISGTYKQGGDVGLLELVLSSDSFEHLVSRIYYANRMAASKEDAINAVNNLQASLEADKSVLEDQQREQEALLVDQVAQFSAMQDAANRQASYVSGLSSEVVAAMEAERIEQTIASLETAREVLSITTAEELTPPAEAPKAAAPSEEPAKAAENTAKSATPAKEEPAKADATKDDDEEEPAAAASTPVAATTTKAATSTSSASSVSSSTSSASSASSVNAASSALAAVNAALEQVGKSYGHENDGEEWDCNGLTNYAWSQAGVDIPYASGTYAYGQFQYMKESDNWVTSEEELSPGDLVFYSQDGGDTTYHVAMYIGDGQIVHAVGYSEGVQVTDLDYVSGFVGGGTPQ